MVSRTFCNLNPSFWWVESYCASGYRRSDSSQSLTRVSYPYARNPGNSVSAHLEFALKHEGLNLEVLRKVIPLMESSEIVTRCLETPTGKYARIIWLLFEKFTAQKLTLPDLTKGNYVQILDDSIFYTCSGPKISRQRVELNLLGDLEFSPLVRKTTRLEEALAQDYGAEASALETQYPPELYQRAIRYFYSKESKSTYSIENEIPSQAKQEGFARLLETADKLALTTEKGLVELQKKIVDPRFANEGYRDLIEEQIYVGESIAPGQERVHYIAPRPQDIRQLMEGFERLALKLSQSEQVPALISAAVLSFVFNFLHPFSDGNGRIHRFLIHWLFKKRHFGPQNFVFPVSAVMIHRPVEYDLALESYSKPLMEQLDYSLDTFGQMKVITDSVDFYRHIDCTALAEKTADFVEETLKSELPAELEFLQQYDEARFNMANIVDLPNREADLFLKFVRDNGGVLSRNRRKQGRFALLTEEEISELETVVKNAFKLT